MYCAFDSQDTWPENTTRDASSKVDALYRQGTPLPELCLTAIDENSRFLHPR